jgi:hypothetical protein
VSTGRQCGAGCGRKLRKGQIRLAHVLTVLGGLERASVCTPCSRRGVLLVPHIDEPTLLPPAPAKRKRPGVDYWLARTI